MSTPPRALDALDRQIVAALQRDGRASWTEIAEQCGATLPTVTRRGQSLLTSKALRVGVSSDINSPGVADLFVLRIACRAGTQVAVAKALAQRTDLRFLCLVTGGSDLLAELVCRRADSMHVRQINEILAIDGVEGCESDLVLHAYKVSQHWAQGATSSRESSTELIREPHVCDPSHFDETDLLVLRELRADGRASFRSVADAIGVNESTVRRRFEAMRDRGCAWVLTLVAAPALGFESEIILNIKVAPTRIDAIAGELASYVGVRYLAATLNGTLMCEVIMPSSEDVFTFLTEGLGRIDGVLGWSASVELLTVKRGFLETPWWLDAVDEAPAPA
ncbi:Lrp/AsnC family transcriptional regulator [Terrabacter aeriphilus]|uniref:Lrp/AsnC family transcriptional regulator n=1 Tax=Terrabacter aeriphilus TaxID=515662 RepID=A0ABP9J367_9MICO